MMTKSLYPSRRVAIVMMSVILFSAEHPADVKGDQGNSRSPDIRVQSNDGNRLEARAAIDEAIVAAGKVPNSSESALLLASAADVLWSIDQNASLKVFERALDRAKDALTKADANPSARSAFEGVVRLYAKRVPGKIGTLFDGITVNSERNSSDQAHALAEFIARVALELLPTDSIGALKLGKESLKGGYITNPLLDLIGRLPLDARRQLATESMRALRKNPLAGTNSLVRLELKLRLFRSRDPIEVASDAPADLLREWVSALSFSLQSMYTELRSARAAGRAFALGDAELSAVRANKSYFLGIFAVIAPEQLASVQPVIDALALEAPTLVETPSASLNEFFKASQLGPTEMVAVAERQRDPEMADALFRLAAYHLATQSLDTHRVESSASVIERIRTESLRAITRDEIALANVKAAVSADEWSRVITTVKRLSNKTLRIQTLGACAYAAGQKKRPETVEILTEFSRELEAAGSSIRITSGLIDACLGAHAVDDKYDFDRFFAEALTRFDNDNVELSGGLRPKFIVDLAAQIGPTSVSAAYPPSFATVLKVEVFDAAFKRDPVGLRLSLTGLKTAERRAEAFLVLGRMLLR